MCVCVCVCVCERERENTKHIKLVIHNVCQFMYTCTHTGQLEITESGNGNGNGNGKLEKVVRWKH